MDFIKSFAISLLAFLFLDFVWLGFVMKDFNLKLLSDIGRIKNGQLDVQYGPAVVVYILMALAVAFFVLPQIGNNLPLWRSFLIGAMMGLIVFGIFDMTNLAILKNYPLLFAIIDICWGVFIFGFVSCLNQIILKN